MPSPSDHPALDAYCERCALHVRGVHATWPRVTDFSAGFDACRGYADALRDEYEARVKKLEAKNASLLAEARAHAAEARVQRGTVNECLQVASGATGEKGDWYGAQPVRDRIAALEAELATERGKRCDWLSEDCTDAATYIPEIDAVRFSQGVRDDCSTVYIGKEEADAILALLTAEQGADND